jgi:hypothetical protein
MLARAITHASLWAAMFVSCVWGSRARAAPELALDWPTVAGCPTRVQVEQRIEAQLARTLGDGSVPLAARASIASDESGFTLRLSTQRGSERGERQFSARTCSEVAEAAALLLALSLAEPEPEPEPELAPDRQPPPATPSGPRSDSIDVELFAGALGEAGFMPRVAAGAELGVGALWKRSHLDLWGLLLPAVESDRVGAASVRVALFTVRAGYCHDLLRSRVTLSACGGVEVGGARGRGIGLASRRDSTLLWSAAFVSLRASLALTRHFGLYLEPTLAVPFDRPRFVVRDAASESATALHAPSPVSGRLALGARVPF